MPTNKITGRATVAAAESLHGTVAQALLHNFQIYQQNPEERIPPAFFNVCTAFLRLCGATSPAEDTPHAAIAEELQKLVDGTRPH